MKISAQVADWTLRQYKRWISPLLPPACRYVPSCSEYAAEAVACHGFLRGSTLALWRLVRCHPFVKGGYDPVPGSQFPGLRDARSASTCAHHLDLDPEHRQLRTEN